MSKTEFSRIVLKRSTVPNVIPTIPTGTTIDNTWLDTDILIGEGFINVADDRMWYRTNNGLIELALSGFSQANYYTTSAYLSGNTIMFNRTDSADAYSVDLSSILTGATSDNYVTGGTYNGLTGELTLNRQNGSIIITGMSSMNGTSGTSGINGTSGTSGINGTSGTSGINGLNGTSGINGTSGTSGINGTSGTSGINGLNGTSGTSGVSSNSGWSADTSFPTSVYQNNGSNNNVLNDFALAANRETTAQGKSSAAFNYQTTAKAEGSATFGSGTTSAALWSFVTGRANSTTSTADNSAILGGSDHLIDSGGVNSVIIGGNANTIQANVNDSVIIGGSGINASRDNTVYVPALNIQAPIPGTAVALLGLSNSGNVVSASTITDTDNYVTGGTYSTGTLTLNRQNGSISINGFLTGSYLPTTGGTVTGDIILDYDKYIKSTFNANVGIGFDSSGNDGVRIYNEASLYADSSLELRTGTAQLGNYSTNGFVGLYTNTSWIEIFDQGNLILNGSQGVTLGVNQNYQVYAVDNSAGNVSSTNSNKYGTFISSRNSTINSGVYNSVILGGSGITATANNTVYVPNLNIKSIGSGSPVINLGLDSSGNVVTGSTTIDTDNYVTGGTYSSGTLTLNRQNGSVNITGFPTQDVYTTGATLNGKTLVFNTNQATSAYTVSLSTLTIPVNESFAISDETTSITSGTTKLTYYIPYGFTISNVYASLSTTGSTSSQFDINVNDSSILSTKITIDANEAHSKDATTAPVLSTTTLNQFDKLTFDIDTAGTGAKGAKIYIIGTRTI